LQAKSQLAMGGGQPGTAALKAAQSSLFEKSDTKNF